MVCLGHLALKHILEGNVIRMITPPPMLHKVDGFLNDELHLCCSSNFDLVYICTFMGHFEVSCIKLQRNNLSR